MPRFFRASHKHKGTSPGSAIFSGVQKMEKPLMKIFLYNTLELFEKEISALAEIDALQKDKQILWLNIYGVHDVSLITELAEQFQVHPLQLEDILNTDQRPKMETDSKHLYFFLKMLKYDEEKNHVTGEQISIILGENYVITLQEQPGDVFDALRTRLRENKGRIRKCGSDYLAYALLDIITDNYIINISEVGGIIENNEEKLIGNLDEALAKAMFIHKMDINYLRKTIRPVSELANGFIKTESDLLTEKTHPFIKDLIDHLNHGIDAIESYGQILNDQINLYNVLLSNRMNQIMKVLTVFAAIFIPLTFIAGVYGTNFEFIPELKWKYSYFFFLGGTLLVGFIMILFFKKKKWF